MNRNEANLIMARYLESQERNRLLSLSERFLYPPYTKKELLAVAPPLPEADSGLRWHDDVHVSYKDERMSDGYIALVDVEINGVPVDEIAVKLKKH